MEEKELQQQLAERFKQLPKVVQDAITSADVEKHMRALAETHKLHLDQWALLENEVMLTLLGFEKTEDLAENLKSEVGIDEATAKALADDVSRIVFEPIRSELEQALKAPQEHEAIAEAEKSIEAAPAAPIGADEAIKEEASTPPPAQVAPATPPRTPPEQKVERAPVSPTYGAPVASHERKDIAGDPYREQL